MVEKKQKKKRKNVKNPWLDHVKEFRETHKDMKYKDVLVEARKTYTKK